MFSMWCVNYFSKCIDGEISFTFNTWTSKGTGNCSYLSLTAHFIDSTEDQPDQWMLRDVQLAFAPLEGHHTRANIASILSGVLERYGIREKVCIVFMLGIAAKFLVVGMVYC
jgi:hypothetical protein